MKNETKNALRAQMAQQIMQFLAEKGEDVGFMASNIINLPATTPDGEEFEFEIKISIPKSTEDNDCYAKRQSYELTQKEKAEKQKEAAAAKARKIARDQALRAEKAARRAAKATQNSQES